MPGLETRAGVIEDARRRQRRHRGAGAALVAAAALAAALLAARLGNHGGSDGLGGPVPAAWRHAGSGAFLAVVRHDHACAGRPDWGEQVRTLRQAPPKALTSALAVLSKPASGGSRVSPPVIGERLRGDLLDAQGIYIRYARRGYAAGLAYYLIPVAHLGFGHVPPRCYVEELAAFKDRTAPLPISARDSALKWERQMVRTDQAGGPPGIALITVGFGGVSQRNYTIAELHNNPYGGGGGGGNDTVTKTALVVPNNVASVTAHYSAQSGPGRVTRPVTVTRPAVNNLVIFVYRGAWDPPELTYRSSSGAALSVQRN